MGDLSIDAWVRWDSTASGSRILVDNRNSAGFVQGYAFSLSNGLLALTLADGTATTFVASGSPLPPDGEWHLVAVSVDRDDATGGEFYLDGVLVSTFDPTVRPGSVNSQEPLRVGSRSPSVGELFPGSIDEVEIFARAISGDEVRSLFRSSSEGKCKESCALPWDAPFCLLDSSITVDAQICNWKSTPQTYTYTFAGIGSGVGCIVDGPTVFSPPSGTVTVPPGECATVSVTIDRPSGLVAVWQVACYEMTITNTATLETYCCRGSVQDRRDICTMSSFQWAAADVLQQVDLGPFTLVGGPPGPATVPYRVLVLDDAMELDGEFVSLNGLPPGTPVTGMLDLTTGMDSIDLSGKFVAPTALRFHTVVIETDSDGDGSSDPLTSVGVLNRPGGSCTGPSRQVTRVGTPPNPIGLLPGVTAAPIIGATWDPVVVPPLGGVVAILLLDPTGATLSVPTPFGTLLCQVPPPSFLFLGTPGIPFAVPVPNDCSLVGLTPCAQGGAILAVGPLVLELYNALDLTIGSF